MERSGSCGVVRPIISDFHSDDPGSNPGTSTQWSVLERVSQSKMELCSQKQPPSSPTSTPQTRTGAFAGQVEGQAQVDARHEQAEAWPGGAAPFLRRRRGTLRREGESVRSPARAGHVVQQNRCQIQPFGCGTSPSLPHSATCPRTRGSGRAAVPNPAWTHMRTATEGTSLGHGQGNSVMEGP